MIQVEALDWGIFWAALAVVLVSDGLAGRREGLRNAVLWSGIWIGVGVLFGVWLMLRFDATTGLTYLTAYALEKSLSIDNLFIFALIFAQTGVPPDLQRRALFWGIAGALAMRAVLIGAGVYLLGAFDWLIYVFAALLVVAAVRMLRGEEKQRQMVEASCSICSSWVARFIPITPQLDGSRFLVRKDGRLAATPLLVALALIEGADLVFAIDSIPAVLAVTREPYLVYSSNVLALLGLRSLYFVLAGAMRKLRFLRTGLAVMLLFVAAKMLLGDVIHVPPGVSLAVIALIFTASIAASRLFPDGSSDGEAAVRACGHLGDIKDLQPGSGACAECLKLGDRWLHLRMCLSCGNVACCDSSKNKHATKHFQGTGHPVMRSIEPGESWRWCYVDRRVV